MTVQEAFQAVVNRVNAVPLDATSEIGPLAVSWERERDDKHASVRMVQDHGGMEYLIGNGLARRISVSGDEGPGNATFVADQLIAYFRDSDT